MTAPNQPYPSLLQTVGIGAFEVGGAGGGSGDATNYGQNFTSDIVTTLINGPAAAMLSGANLVTDIADVLTNLSTYLSTMPLEALQVFEGFLPGTVAADFVDIETAVATIVSNLGLGNMGVALGEFSAWLSSTFAPLVTLVQNFIDAVANALGHSGVGHLVTQIETYLSAIPNANVTAILGSSNLGADMQAVVDKISNALGSAGTGHTLANLLSFMGEIPPANVTSVVSGGTNLAADVQGIVDKLANGLGATGTGHTLANLLSYIEAIPQTNVSNLGNAWTALFGSSSAPTTGSTVQYPALPSITIGGVATDIESHIQNIVDGIFQSQNGGTTTGNPTSSIVPSLTAIPTSNIVGGAGAAVTFGAVGASAYATHGTSSASTTETHTIAVGDLGVLAVVSYQTNGATTSTSSVTYGGTAMTMLLQKVAGPNSGGGQYVFLEIWWLKSPASGTKTVAVSVSVPTGVIFALGVDTASYAASKVGTVNYAAGSGSASLSMSTSSATGHMVLGAFAVIENSGGFTLSSFTQTSRYNEIGSGTGNGWGMVFGDAAGASTVTFGVTSSSSAVWWIGITVELTN